MNILIIYRKVYVFSWKEDCGIHCVKKKRYNALTRVTNYKGTYILKIVMHGEDTWLSINLLQYLNRIFVGLCNIQYKVSSLIDFMASPLVFFSSFFTCI